MFDWHAALFPTGGVAGCIQLFIGDWRNDDYGPMQVVSGPIEIEIF